MAERRRRKKALALQWIEYGIFRTVRGLLRILPATAVRRLGRWLGDLGFRFARSRTNLALDNVRRSIPDLSPDERERVVRGCWRHFSTETLSYVRAIDAPADELREHTEILHPEHLEQALAQGNGLIVYTAHFGPWESAIAMLERVGLPFAVVARPLDNELLETMLIDSRKRFDVEMVPKRNAARTLMRRLASREGVLVLPDQAVRPREGILVPFLGRPAWTTAAPARLALRYGTPILGAFCYRRDGQVVAEVSEPIVTTGLDESDANVEMITRRMNDEISSHVRREPSSWLWMHDRWKNVD